VKLAAPIQQTHLELYILAATINEMHCFAVEEKLEPIKQSVVFRDYNSEKFEETTKTFLEAGLVQLWHSIHTWIRHRTIRRTEIRHQVALLVEQGITISSKMVTVFSLCSILILLSIITFVVELLLNFSYSSTHIVMLF